MLFASSRQGAAHPLVSEWQRECATLNTSLQSIAEIVHDIDLKDSKFGREEVGGLRTLIAGVTVAHAKDEDRLTRGGALFDDLYEYFRKKRH